MTVTVDTPEFKSFFDGCIKINHDYCDKWLDGNQKDEFTFKKGRRYIKIIRGGSVHCFLDMTNGNVLKAASWKAPAKHARGNIFNLDNGLGSMGEFGPAYLR